jgi:lantibiotic modifying enzyme
MAHGATGIAHALTQLSAATGDARYLAAAREAIAYERSTASEPGRWPDLRYPASEAPRFATSWCNGAAGIGLARAAGLAILDDPSVREDLDTAIRIVSSLEEEGPDNLCCGSLGRVELLHVAGARLSRPRLIQEAHAQASAVLGRLSKQGPLRLLEDAPAGPEAHTPGLFQGISGAGYALLRLARPEQVPSVLLWE